MDCNPFAWLRLDLRASDDSPPGWSKPKEIFVTCHIFWKADGDWLVSFRETLGLCLFL